MADFLRRTPGVLNVEESQVPSEKDGTCSLVFNHLISAAGARRSTGDAYYDMVVLNPSFDGTNGDTIFADDSNTGRTSSASGSQVIDYTTVKYGVSSFRSYGNSTDKARIPSIANSGLGAGDFTIEMWIRFNTISATTYHIGLGNCNATTGAGDWCIYYDHSASPKNLNLYGNSGSAGGGITAASFGFSTATWYHLAVVRSGTTITWYKDGVSLGTATSSANWTNSVGNTYTFGSSVDGVFIFDGWISDFRVYKGCAKYTSTFTPPTGLMGTNSTDDPYWKYCTVACPMQLSYKNVAGNWPTVGGSAALSSSKSKFGTTSLNIGTSSDYLNYSLSRGLESGDFTIECWLNPQTSSALGAILDNISGSFEASAFGLYFDGSTSGSPLRIKFQSGTTNYAVSSNNALTNNTWQHVACVRSNGTVTIYVNGTSVASAACTQNFSTTNAWRIGVPAYTSSTGLFYLANLRVTVGYARYTSTFTPPTAAFYKTRDETTDPFWSSVVLATHCDGSNGGTTLTDSSSAAHTFTANGSATTSTAVKQYGTASASVPASGSGYFSSADSADWQFTGDFTLDFFMRTGSQPGAGVYYAQVSQYNSSGNQCSWSLAYRNAGGTKKVTFDWSTDGATTGTAIDGDYYILTDFWTHIRVCRQGTTAYLYVNGILLASGTMSGSLFNSTASLTLSGLNAGAASLADGYLDEVRITKGRCRTPGMDFTPPTRAFAIAA